MSSTSNFQMVKKIWRKKAMVMKFFPHVQNCGPSIKMPKNWKNNFGNIFKIFSENCWNIFRKSAKRGRKTPIFEKYFKNVPKIIFSIFWHFYTRPAILYVWKKFHNHSFFPSCFFHHLKIGGRWHISYRLSVLGKASHMVSMVFKLYVRFIFFYIFYVFLKFN